MTDQEIADRYFAAMRAQDVEALLSILDAQCRIVWPDGREIAGHDAIRATYTAMFERPSNNPESGALMSGPNSCACEVHSRLPDGSERRTINVFVRGEGGLVTRMSSYRQG